MIAAFLAIYILLCVWGMTCNARTASQRQKLLDLCRLGSSDFWAQMNRYRSLSYDRHLWLLFTFRNPLNYYAPLSTIEDQHRSAA